MSDPPTKTTNTMAQANTTDETKATKKAKARAERAAKKEKAREKRKQVKSLAKMAEARILKDLSSSLDTHARSATFACGGSLLFKDDAKQNVAETGVEPTEKTTESTKLPKAVAESPALDDVQVRFGESGRGLTTVFGIQSTSSEELKHLVDACQPASFGRGGEAILDEEYRRAGKLDRSQFATSFCPYEAGIIDVITQLLVPQYKHEKHVRSIKAELYKLNVYSAPNGKFKPHVDTPRSENQIGSLVIGLPSKHKGGQLSVTNNSDAKQTLVFDWSDVDGSDPAEIKWAAFYSDCQHEVHEVTSGHRVTLTYNLFLTRGTGHLSTASQAMDPMQLPLYDGLQAALDNPGFLRRGRVLAIFLTHSYAHTNKYLNFLPDSLKGADMSLWSTAQALGLECAVAPVMTSPYGSYYGGDDDATHLIEKRFLGFNEGGQGNFDLDECASWGNEMSRGKVTWLNDYASGETKGKPKEKSQKIVPKYEEVQKAYLSYGNEPDIGIHYSRAAMLIRIPPLSERLSGRAASKTIWQDIKPVRDDYGEYYDDEDYSHSSEDDDEEQEDSEEDDEDAEDEEEEEDGEEKGDHEADDVKLA